MNFAKYFVRSDTSKISLTLLASPDQRGLIFRGRPGLSGNEITNVWLTGLPGARARLDVVPQRYPA